MVHVYSGILLSHKMKQNNAACKDVDGPRDCHPERDKWIYTITYTWNIEKMVWINLWINLKESQMQKTNMFTEEGRMGAVRRTVRLSETYIHYSVQNR